MDKMDGMTMNIEQANVEKLKEVFPEVFADGKVDFNKLQGLLGHYIADDKKKYSFSWKGKADSLRLAQKRSTGTLRPCKEESENWDTTENLYIEGDNLEVLKLLQSSYLNSIKMIYIDPPYNTGNDFVYTDDFADGIAHYKEVTGQATKSNPETAGRYHTNWLNMMYPRLKLARNLLTDDGVIFISIDDNEQANLKKLCDEVFGEDNCVAIVPWQSRASIQNDTDFSVNHEYIIIYSRKRRTENRRLKEANYNTWKNRDSFVVRPLPLDKSKFSNPDNDPRGKWKADPFDAPGVRENLSYEIVNSKTGQSYYPPKGRHWRMEKESYLKNLADDRIVFGASGDARPQLKVFYEEKKEFGSIENSWFSADRIGTTTEGTKEVMDLFDGEDIFDMPKPVSLLSKLLYLSNIDKDSIILDFFSGSSTTAHAIMQLNAEDGGKRKYIMVQFPEDLQKKYDKASGNEKKELENTIEFLKQIHKAPLLTEIGKERIRRAGEKIKEENKDKEGIENLDIGFKVFKLDSSNLVKWDNTPTTDEEEVKKRIQQSLFYLVEGREDLDLVYEIMLKYGLSLTLPVEERKFDNVPAYIINHPDYKVLICLQPNITLSAVEEMDKETIGTYIFADRCFADANILSNTEEILKKKDKEMRLF